MKQLFIFFILFTAPLALFSQSSVITVKILGISEVKGQMSIALYDQADGFPKNKNYFMAEQVAIGSKNFEYQFSGVPNGTYAIAVYHDLDSNGELNSNWVGMPKEPYGFSNDAKGRMGPPDFEDASFEVVSDREIRITLVD